MKKQVRTTTVLANVTRDEREQVAEWAKLHGLSISEYVRMRVLVDPIEKEAA